LHPSCKEKITKGKNGGNWRLAREQITETLTSVAWQLIPQLYATTETCDSDKLDSSSNCAVHVVDIVG